MEKPLNQAEEGTINAAGGMVDMTERKMESLSRSLAP